MRMLAVSVPNPDDHGSGEPVTRRGDPGDQDDVPVLRVKTGPGGEPTALPLQAGIIADGRLALFSGPVLDDVGAVLETAAAVAARGFPYPARDDGPVKRRQMPAVAAWDTTPLLLPAP